MYTRIKIIIQRNQNPYFILVTLNRYILHMRAISYVFLRSTATKVDLYDYTIKEANHNLSREVIVS